MEVIKDKVLCDVIKALTHVTNKHCNNWPSTRMAGCPTVASTGNSVEIVISQPSPLSQPETYVRAKIGGKL